jgi:hypothetical protein
MHDCDEVVLQMLNVGFWSVVVLDHGLHSICEQEGVAYTTCGCAVFLMMLGCFIYAAVGRGGTSSAI